MTDYPDLGYGAMTAAEVHRASLIILAMSTAHVMTVDEMIALTKVPTKSVPAAERPHDRVTAAH